MADEKKNGEKESLTDKLSSLDNSEKIEAVVQYAKTNTLDTIRIVLVIIGLFWLFINSFYAGILIGVVYGITFSDELLSFVKGLKNIHIREGYGRTVVLGVTLLAIFILFPGFFIGAAVAIAIKELFAAGSKK